MTKLTRKIVHIDEEKCDGCGQCVPSCAEGALRVIEGKARLVAEKMCDGLGACLGTCPRGAITVEERPADEFDHEAVKRHVQASMPSRASTPIPVLTAQAMEHAHGHSGMCPGSRMRMMRPAAAAPVADVAGADGAPAAASQLRHWPVQLALVPPTGPIWENAHVLIAADCVPFAYPRFHEKLLAGRSLAIACPKLDDVEPYVQKLAVIFAGNNILSITVAHMQVPCCHGIVRLVQQALTMAGREDIQVNHLTVGVDGTILA